MDMLTDGQWAAVAGLLGGIVLGLAARMGRFCTLGAIEDYFFGDSDIRLRMWGFAIAIAVISTFALTGSGLLDSRQTIYLAAAWNPAASIVGGLMFGYGMALAGNCGYGALARVGGGDLRAFVIVMVMGVSAYMAMSGPTGMMRVWLFPAEPSGEALPGLAHLASRLSGIPVAAVGIIVGLIGGAVLLMSDEFRNDRKALFWSAMVGLAITSGWLATGLIARVGFDEIPVVSHTFSAPLGDSLLYVMTASGTSVSFGVGSVAGVVAGAVIGSLMKGRFRWEACEDPRELRRQMLGAFLMGTGAVIALGCSIGQGLSAFSVLAYSAPVVTASIILGAVIGLRHLIFGFSRAVFLPER